MSVDAAPLLLMTSSSGLPMAAMSQTAAHLHPLCLKTARRRLSAVPLVLSRKPAEGRRRSRPAVRVKSAAASLGPSVTENLPPHDTPVRIVALVGDGSVNPLNSAPWHDVMLHTELGRGDGRSTTTEESLHSHRALRTTQRSSREKSRGDVEGRPPGPIVESWRPGGYAGP
ncbi:unnamed protein product [Cuscuta europaea]|uniref:Uncharacterized protein n=1 Tax=Cuscuta europaea TaxID=41803 RepID=A0A9P1EIJ5_CUSEU|nr:unnamed protein product [Cuscuta europaea]